MNNKVILASGSPRRKQLLQMADVAFEVVVRETDEALLPGLTPQEQTVQIAKNKALAVRDFVQNAVLIAADTIVVLNGKIIGKPADKAGAILTLQQLSAQTHTVVTGVYMEKGDESRSFYETTEVEFYPLTGEQIEYYVDRYRPYDKAGAYAIQEWIGVTGVKSIRGDFYNVMGLPVGRVLQVLQEFEEK